MYLDRVTKIHDNLRDNVKESEFDMTVWLGAYGVTYGCKTVGCAMGHASFLPEFQVLGLKLNIDDIQYGAEPVITFRHYVGYNAVAAFLDMTRQEAEYLFHPEKYKEEPTKKVVLERIAKFIAKEKEKL